MKKIRESDLIEVFRKLLEEQERQKEYYIYADNVLVDTHLFCGRSEEEAINLFLKIHPECKNNIIEALENA